jgi:hypothetical protein
MISKFKEFINSLLIINPKKNIVWDLLYAQVSILVFLILSSIILPYVPLNGKGISAFGVNINTIIPYSVGYILYAYFIARSVKFIIIKDNISKVIYYSFNTISILFIALIFTPYSIDTSFDWIHTTVSTSLFLIELALSIYLIYYDKFNFSNIVLLFSQIIGGLISMFSLSNNGGLHLLFEGEIIFQVFFIIIMFKIIPKFRISYK